MTKDDLFNAALGAKPNVIPSPDGAMGANKNFENGKSADVWIDQQARAGDWIQLGLTHDQASWIAMGWKGIRYGLSLQTSDGHFQERAGVVVGNAMFIESFARAVLLERAAGHEVDPGEIESLRKALGWLVKQDPDNDPTAPLRGWTTHHQWLMADALATAASVVGGDEATKARVIAEAMARRAIAHQWPNGVFPEAGGPDVGYMSIGMVFGIRYATLCNDPELKMQIIKSLQRGADWLALRVESNGNMDATGSTRVFKERDREGSIKEIPYGWVVGTFAGIGYLTKDKKYTSIAMKVLRSPGFAEHAAPHRKPPRWPEPPVMLFSH